MKKSKILTIILILAMVISLVPAVLVSAGAQTEVPVSEAPVVEVPVSEAPVVEVPVSETPVLPPLGDDEPIPEIPEVPVIIEDEKVSYNVIIAEPGEDGSTVTADKLSAKGEEVITLTSKAATGKIVDAISVVGSDGSSVSVTKAEDGTYTFKMPYSNAYVTPTFKAGVETPVDKDGFKDVDDDDWFRQAVIYVVDKGYMTAESEGVFGVTEKLTRADAITLIWKVAGSPKATAAPEFTDVKEGDAAYDAIAWGVEAGIVKGTSETEFDPDGLVNREQFCTMLYNYVAKVQEKGFTGVWTFLLDFDDREDISEWAYEAVCWLTMNGVINGTGDGSTFSPNAEITKVEAATIIMRFEQIGEKDPAE